jgi:hypothetical protein
VPTPESTPTAPADRGRRFNRLGLVALVVAIVGLVFAVLPPTYLLGEALLPVALILALVSFSLPGRKGLGIAALIVAVAGIAVAILSFFLFLSS